MARSGMVTFLAVRLQAQRAMKNHTASLKKRVWNDLQLALRSLTVAGAAQVGKRPAVHADFAPCFPFDCERS
jgi:hypothetical protein